MSVPQERCKYTCDYCQFPIPSSSLIDLSENIKQHAKVCTASITTEFVDNNNNLSTSNAPIPPTTYSCAICTNEELTSDQIFFTGCPKKHILCIECLERLATIDIHDRRVVCCPLNPCAQEPTSDNPNRLHRIDFSMLEVYVKEKVPKHEWEEYLRFLAIVEMSRSPCFCPCPNASCKNGVLAPSPPTETNNHKIHCERCNIDFCSFCRETYHYKMNCKQAKEIRDQWNHYNLVQRVSDKKKMEENRRIWERNKAAFDADETFNSQTCKLCPHCNRVVKHEGGCNSMKCGSDYHGGNLQSGCQQSFDWSKAKPYQKQSTPPCALPTRSTNTKHSLYSCNKCHKEIVGIRFSCVHCIGVDFCGQCEEVETSRHDPTHWFRLITQPTDN